MNIDQLVSAENIAYKINDNKLFHNISFFLEKGKALHICGSNGSGKSTLIRIILGLTNLQLLSVSDMFLNLYLSR